MNLLTFAVHAPPYSPPGAAGGRLKLDGWLFNEIIAYFNEIIAYFHEIITYFDEIIAPFAPPEKVDLKRFGDGKCDNSAHHKVTIFSPGVLLYSKVLATTLWGSDKFGIQSLSRSGVRFGNVEGLFR